MPSAERIERELYDKNYLVGKTLRWKRILPYGEGDGELCVFCWKELRASLSHIERDEGFQEENSRDWICFPCMEAFLNVFDWKLKWPIEPQEIGPNGVPIL